MKVLTNYSLINYIYINSTVCKQIIESYLDYSCLIELLENI